MMETNLKTTEYALATPFSAIISGRYIFFYNHGLFFDLHQEDCGLSSFVSSSPITVVDFFHSTTAGEFFM